MTANVEILTAVERFCSVSQTKRNQYTPTLKVAVLVKQLTESSFLIGFPQNQGKPPFLCVTLQISFAENAGRAGYGEQGVASV